MTTTNFDFEKDQLDTIARQYKISGVVRIKNLLNAAELREIRAALARYEREILPGVPEGDRTFEADGKTVRNLWRLEQHDPYFLSLTQRPDIQKLVARLVHGEPVLGAVETFNKPARIGSAVPWHQDNLYFCQSPPDMLTVWIAIDPATVENGAVYYAPGTQNRLVPHQPSGVLGNSMKASAAPDVTLEDQFCGVLEPGDALIHHSQTLHRSEPNTSEQSRLGLLMVFRGAHTQTDPALQADYEKARDGVERNDV
jgi:ectoine hydroxylase-related dioxygenase (phytanoyl-CoA dioxygenase family)